MRGLWLALAVLASSSLSGMDAALPPAEVLGEAPAPLSPVAQVMAPAQRPAIRVEPRWLSGAAGILMGDAQAVSCTKPAGLILWPAYQDLSGAAKPVSIAASVSVESYVSLSLNAGTLAAKAAGKSIGAMGRFVFSKSQTGGRLMISFQGSGRQDHKVIGKRDLVGWIAQDTDCARFGRLYYVFRFRQPADEVEDKDKQVVFHFSATRPFPVTVKAAFSHQGVADARRLLLENVSGWDFDEWASAIRPPEEMEIEKKIKPKASEK